MPFRKVDPGLGNIEFDVKPRVEVVAYPTFDRKQVGNQPVTHDPENFQYCLSVGTSSYYIAEGAIRFPTLNEQPYHFEFKTLKNKPMGDNNYQIMIGHSCGWHTRIVMKQFLDEADLGKSRHRSTLAEIIDKNIERFFLGDNHGSTPQCFGFIHVNFLLTEGERLASDSYQPKMERALKEDPTLGILPKKYIYDCGPLDEALLIPCL